MRQAYVGITNINALSDLNTLDSLFLSKGLMEIILSSI
jgi:hypothetical protein